MNSIDDFKDIKRQFKKNLISLNNQLEQIQDTEDLGILTDRVDKARKLRA